MVCNVVVVGLSRLDSFFHRNYEMGKLNLLKKELMQQGVKQFVNTQTGLDDFEREIVSIFKTTDADLKPDVALFITSDPQFSEKYAICDNDKVYYIIY